MTLETKSQFARRLGIDKSHLSRKKDGKPNPPEWLVMDGDLVNVEESIRLREIFASPKPHHVAHAQQLADGRHAKTPTAEAVAAAMRAMEPLEPPLAGRESPEAASLRQKIATADRLEHEADKARMEREQMAGNLIQREDVWFALDDMGAILRTLMDNFADRITPIVHPLQSYEEQHAANAEFAQDVLQTMSDRLAQRANEWRRP